MQARIVCHGYIWFRIISTFWQWHDDATHICVCCVESFFVSLHARLHIAATFIYSKIYCLSLAFVPPPHRSPKRAYGNAVSAVSSAAIFFIA